MASGLVVLFDGGKVPDGLVHRADRLGVEVCPNVEFLEPSGPRVLMAPMTMVGQGLAAGFQGFVEHRAADLACPLCAELVEAVEQGGVCLSASTASLLENDPVRQFCQAAGRLAPALDVTLMELGLAEAVGNAIVHGNLGLQSDLRHSLAGLVEFNQRIAERTADPTLAARRVRITARPAGAGLEIRVSDDGAGYDLQAELARPLDVAAKSGRGLGLIRKLCAQVRGENGGRTLCMLFQPQP